MALNANELTRMTLKAREPRAHLMRSRAWHVWMCLGLGIVTHDIDRNLAHANWCALCLRLGVMP